MLILLLLQVWLLHKRNQIPWDGGEKREDRKEVRGRREQEKLVICKGLSSWNMCAGLSVNSAMQVGDDLFCQSILPQLLGPVIVLTNSVY